MANKLFWLPLPVERWLAEIAGALLPEQEGALLRLSCVSWVQTPPCTLPNNEAYLASKSGLGTRWKKLAPEILAHFSPTDDGTRLVCTWAKAIYDEQLGRYERRKQRNERHRHRDGTESPPRRRRRDASEASQPPSHRASHTPSQLASQVASQPASQNGAETSLFLARKNLELRSSTELTNVSSSTAAPKARASADEARAAPGARVEESPYASSDESASGRAVDTRRGGGAPEAITDVIQQLRPPGAVIRPSVAKERELAIAWAHEHPERATEIERELQEGEDRKLWEKAKPKQRESMLVSAFVKAMNVNGHPVPEHAEASHE